jgi:hypothetical protein
MVALLMALALIQDPAEEEIRTILRRFESGPVPAAESSELLTRLTQAVERVAAPRGVRALLSGALRDERLPAARRLDVAEALFQLEDRETWAADAERLALDAAQSPETRLRAALLLARADHPAAAGVARDLDELLFKEGTDEAAKALGDHLRSGEASPGQQRREIEMLLRLATPAARAALWRSLTDPAFDPGMRLLIAEGLHAAGRIDRVRDAVLALEQVRAADSELASRVDVLLKALRGRREEPRETLASAPAHPGASPGSAAPPGSSVSPNRVNLIVAGVTALLLALLVGFKRRP